MTAEQPLVSILMPYYNMPALIKESVESVKSQTYSNWELVIVDDASPNSSAQADLSDETDSRIKIFRNSENLGVGQTKNVAAKNSSGTLLLPLDGDDKIAPTYLERTTKALAEAGADAVHTDVQAFGERSYIYKPVAKLSAIYSGVLPHNTFLYKRELHERAGGYLPNCNTDDTEFWIKLLELGTSFAYIPEPLYFYRKRSDSVTSNDPHRLWTDYMQVLEIHKESLTKCVPEILQNWLKAEEERQRDLEAYAQLEAEYKTLHGDFHKLLNEYETLKERTNSTETALGSIRHLVLRLVMLISGKKTIEAAR